VKQKEAQKALDTYAKYCTLTDISYSLHMWLIENYAQHYQRALFNEVLGNYILYTGSINDNILYTGSINDKNPHHQSWYESIGLYRYNIRSKNQISYSLRIDGSPKTGFAFYNIDIENPNVFENMQEFVKTHTTEQ